MFLQVAGSTGKVEALNDEALFLEVHDGGRVGVDTIGVNRAVLVKRWEGAVAGLMKSLTLADT